MKSNNKKVIVSIIGTVVVFATVAVMYCLYASKKALKKENDALKLKEKIRTSIDKNNKQLQLEAPKDTFEIAKEKLIYLKRIIEERNGYRILYQEGKPIKKEKDLHILYDLTYEGANVDVNKEVNNGRGSADFAISKGSIDKTIVEFKLASNPKLKKNIQNQVEIYKKANNTKKSIVAILFFTIKEQERLNKILEETGVKEEIVIIDARNDNKVSASVA